MKCRSWNAYRPLPRPASRPLNSCFPTNTRRTPSPANYRVTESRMCCSICHQGTGMQANAALPPCPAASKRSEEHTSELQSLMRISYAVFCLKKKTEQFLRNNDDESDKPGLKTIADRPSQPSSPSRLTTA